MKTIQILGTGCTKCNRLAELADLAATEMNIKYQLVKVTNLAQITGFGVMITPALAVDGVVKVAGRLPNIQEIKEMLK